MTARFDGLTDPDEIGYVAAKVIGQTLDTSRVGYGTIDPIAETLHVERDWTAPGVKTLAGVTPLREYGSFIDSLKRGEFISISDVEKDERTASAAAALQGYSSFSFMNVPVIENGSLVAVLFVNNGSVRHWTDDERAFMTEAGARTRSAVERSRSGTALRELNTTLQERIDRALTEQAATEAALRQAQKMEAVGQLTGGLAHDFNNLLAIVSGNLELMASRIGRNRFDDLDRFMTSAQSASKRATSLTHRLLAFSRRQTLDPRATSINELVYEIRDMVSRSVGPEVTVELVTAHELWTSFVDRNQLENALLNLCLNARDAMPTGGKLIVETSNQVLDGGIAAVRDLPPGDYVALSVSDTGTGMSADTIDRVFEPFFTTKPMGQGTGLGLSMVYGFARQSDGQVRIHSEVGHGTTVTIYLPRSDRTIASESVDLISAPQKAKQGRVVMIVDDEPAVRMLVREVLDELGYEIIEAGTGQAALKILQTGARVDLLITDVGMPVMNGRQLADAARVSRPHLKTLFITGYAEASIVSHGHLDADMAIITKPFALDILANKVTSMVDDTTD